jgi:hypothetical protein
MGAYLLTFRTPRCKVRVVKGLGGYCMTFTNCTTSGGVAVTRIASAACVNLLFTMRKVSTYKWNHRQDMDASDAGRRNTPT